MQSNYTVTFKTLAFPETRVSVFPGGGLIWPRAFSALAAAALPQSMRGLFCAWSSPTGGLWSALTPGNGTPPHCVWEPPGELQKHWVPGSCPRPTSIESKFLGLGQNSSFKKLPGDSNVLQGWETAGAYSRTSPSQCGYSASPWSY